MIGHARDEVAEVAAGEGPLEWLGDLVVVVLEVVETVDDGLQAGESLGVRSLRWMTEKTISTWFSHEA